MSFHASHSANVCFLVFQKKWEISLLTLAVQNTCSKMGTCKHMATINTQKQKFKQHRFKHGGLVLITLYHGCRIHVQRDPHKNLGFPLPTVHTYTRDYICQPICNGLVHTSQGKKPCSSCPTWIPQYRWRTYGRIWLSPWDFAEYRKKKAIGVIYTRQHQCHKKWFGS